MRDIFDAIAKDILENALSPAGTVRMQHEIRSPSQFADVWFEPDPARTSALAAMGLLGRIAGTPCLIEPFHDGPTPDEVRACLRKLLAVHHRRARAGARGESPKLVPPLLWILTSTRSKTIVELFGLRPMHGWPHGCVRAAAGLGLHVIVLPDLPRVRETLLLRLLGAGQVLARAIAELSRLPAEAAEREIALDPLLAYGPKIPHDPAGEEEIAMSAAESHAIAEKMKREWRREGLEEGREEGREQGREEGREKGLRQSLFAIYATRFGTVPRAITAAVEATHDPAVLERWIAVFMKASAAEVAATVGGT